MELILSIVGAILVGLILFYAGMVFTMWSLRKIKVYIGATYTNGYTDVCVENIKDNKVIWFDVEYGGELQEIDAVKFITQFKLKDIQGE